LSYIYFAIETAISCRKSIGWCGKAFIAAFIPLGTFITDNALKKEEKAPLES
jgi:hypothetical protein